jgi:hypothetical protein
MAAKLIHLYDLKAPDRPRWIPGDQYPRQFARALLRPWRGRPPGGLAKVTENLCLGLEKIGQPYRLHHRPDLPRDGGTIGILHGPLDLVRPLAAARPCVTGVGVLDFPDQWPGLFEESRAIWHLQACEWAAAYYRPFYGDRVRIWPVGIDTEACAPRPAVEKEFDFLVYTKLRWPQEHPEAGLREFCLEALAARGLRVQEIAYGRYPKGRENSFHELLARSRAMLFLCENETQGIAYNEALSMGVPILAWNPRRWLDPNRHRHGLGECPASTIPYWDARCGEEFLDRAAFGPALERFLEGLNSGAYHPRDYILENLTLEKCTRRYLELLASPAR